MSTTRRDGTGDTAENDVRELRRQFADSRPPALPDETYVRHREDVPHEGALPDLYALAGGDEVNAELAIMVEDGDLHCGWDEEKGEFIYWVPEESEWEDITPCLQGTPAPAAKHKRPSLRTRRNASRRMMLTLAASMATFLVGMIAEASLDNYAHPGMERPDEVADEKDLPAGPAPAPTVALTSEETLPTADDYRPKTNTGRHARRPSVPEVEKPGNYVGRHRKPDAKTAPPKGPGASKRRTPAAAKPKVKAHGRPRNPRAEQSAVREVASNVEKLMQDLLRPVA